MHIQANTQFWYSVNYNKSVMAIAKEDCAAGLKAKALLSNKWFKNSLRKL